MTDTPLNVYQTRVRTHQTDLNGAMYHGDYLDICDDARIETFRRMGYTYERMLAGGWTAVIRRVDCEFYAPAHMDDLVNITVTVPKLSRATMTLRYECRSDDELLAIAHAVFAFVDVAGGRPLRFPPDLRATVESHAELLLATPR